MKTNHQRGFEDKRHHPGLSKMPFVVWNSGKRSSQTPLSGVEVQASATVIGQDYGANGKHGVAKAVRGAKKFVRSRVRFHVFACPES